MTTVSLVLSLLIAAFGVFTGLKLHSIYRELKGVDDQFEKKVRKLVRDRAFHSGIGDDGSPFVYRGSEIESFDRAELDRLRKEWDRLYPQYNEYIQMIPIFPLLGILGTVLGLAGKSTAQDIQVLLSGFSMALYTTLSGLVCSIVLKFLDAAIFGKQVVIVDQKFTEADTAIEKETLIRTIEEAAYRSIEAEE